MAGHPLLNQVRTKSEPLVVDGKAYQIILSYNRVIGIDGYVIGLKFADETGSMDSSKVGNTRGHSIARAVAYRAVQMLKPDLATISIIGFYLLTDDLTARSARGKEVKMRLYRAQARNIQAALVTKLQNLTEIQVEGGSAWMISENPYQAYSQFTTLEKELAKQLRVVLC